MRHLPCIFLPQVYAETSSKTIENMLSVVLTFQVAGRPALDIPRYTTATCAYFTGFLEERGPGAVGAALSCMPKKQKKNGIYESARPAAPGPRSPTKPVKYAQISVAYAWNIKCLSTGYLACRDDGQPVFDGRP